MCVVCVLLACLLDVQLQWLAMYKGFVMRVCICFLLLFVNHAKKQMHAFVACLPMFWVICCMKASSKT